MLTRNATYGNLETPNQLGSVKAGQEYHSQFNEAPTVYWDAKGLKITRFRILTDPGFPAWDVSYCHGRLNGKPVNVDLPFAQMPKRGWKRYVVEMAKKDGVYAKGLGILDPINISAIS